MVTKWSFCEEMMNLRDSVKTRLPGSRSISEPGNFIPGNFRFYPGLTTSVITSNLLNKKNPVQGREQDFLEGGRGSPPSHIIFILIRGENILLVKGIYALCFFSLNYLGCLLPCMFVL